MLRFNLTLNAIDAITLPPYKGSTFRGGFGHAFKKVVCTIKRETCDDCLLKSKCIYSYIFETPPPENSEILRKYEKAPHPFVIEPPLETKTHYNSGDTITFGLVLIGRAVDYLPYFIYTFEELGRIGIGKGRGKYELQEVRQGDCPGFTDGSTISVVESGLSPVAETVIYRSEDKRLKQGTLNSPSILSYLKRGQKKLSPSLLKRGAGEVTPDISRSRTTNTVSLDFLTPARLIVNEDLVVEPEFHHIIRPLLRRLSSLSYFHYGERLDIDFKGLIERAQKVKVKERATEWHDWERYSARQDVRMKMGGFVGNVSFEGDLGEFMPFIELGEMLHVGKGTSFGLGKYEIKR